MSQVKALGYVGCDVSDPKAWQQMLGEVFALEQRSDSHNGVHQYRMDAHHHRLCLYASKHDALRYIGWEVETQQDLDELARSLENDGIAITWGDDALRAERAVMDLITLDGPDGIQLEVFFGAVQDFLPFTPKRGIDGYNTGEFGMGHVVLSTADRAATVQWYQDHLGFRLSDHVFWEGIEASFLHCNPRHHSLAFTNRIRDMQGGELGHFMLESTSIDDVGRAYDIVKERGFPLALTLGKHTNDQTTSFYVYSPSGWWIEYGFGGRTIDDDDAWEPKLYNSPKIWGHDMLPPPKGYEVKI